MTVIKFIINKYYNIDVVYKVILMNELISTDILLDNMALLLILKKYEQFIHKFKNSNKRVIIPLLILEECLEHHKKSIIKESKKNIFIIMGYIYKLNKLLSLSNIFILNVDDALTDKSIKEKGDRHIDYVMNNKTDIILFSHDPFLQNKYSKRCIHENKLLLFI